MGAINWSFLKQDQTRTVVWSACLLFFIIAAFIVMKSARDAFVLSQFSGETLPYFMIATTLAIGLVVSIQWRVSDRLSLCRVAGMSLVVFAAGTFALDRAVVVGASFAVPVFYVWAGVFGAVVPMLAWSIIGRRLRTREAKRSIGIIGGGGVAGSIGGGLMAERIADWGSTHLLLPAAALLMIIALVPVTGLGLCPSVAREADERDDDRARAVRRRFVAAVLLIVALGSVVSTFAEFQFKIIAQRELRTVESLTGFFGWFYAYLGIATLVVQVIVTPLLIRWLGVVGGLALLPSALLAGNGMLLAFGSLWAAVFLRGGEQLFKHSIDRSSLEVLYTAVPAGTRVRLKSVVDAFGVRAAESIAGILLLVLFSILGFSLSVIAALSIVLVGAWLVATVFLHREHREILSEAIEREDTDIEDLKKSLFGPDFNRLIPYLLTRTSSRTWIHLLDLLQSGQHRRLGSRLVLLLGNPEAEVRLKTLQLLASQPRDYSSAVEKLLRDPDRSVRTEAVRYLCTHSEQPMGRLFSFIQDPDPSVQIAACSCSMIQENQEAREVALAKLKEIFEASFDPDKPQVRQEIAQVLGDLTRDETAVQMLEQLLTDPSVEVRRATLKSIARNRAPEMVPMLLSSWDEPALWPDLRASLVGHGRLVVPHLQQLLPDPTVPTEMKKLLVQVASDIGDQACVDLLLSAAHGENLTIRFAALKGLNRVHERRGLDGLRPEVRALLENEIQELENNRDQTRLLASPPSSLVARVLSERRRWTEERLFRILGMIYKRESIYHAYLAFTGENRQLADTALELLESLLDAEHRRRVVALLENTAPENGFPTPDQRKDLILKFLASQDTLAASAAVLELTQEELWNWRRELEEKVSAFAPDSLFTETLQWRYKMQSNEHEAASLERSLTTIQKLESLSRVDLFSRLGPHELLILANKSIVQDYSAGEVMYRAGETAHHIYNLIQGKVELRRDPEPVEEVLPGGSFGALAVLSRKPRFFTARVVEPSRCIKVDRETFWEMMEDYPSASRAIFEVMAGQILTMMGRLSH